MKLNKLSLALIFSGTLLFQAIEKNEINLKPIINSVNTTAAFQTMPANIKGFLAKYYPKATVAKY